MKKLLVLVAAAAGIATYRKWKESETEKSVWKESTDLVDEL